MASLDDELRVVREGAARARLVRDTHFLENNSRGAMV